MTNKLKKEKERRITREREKIETHRESKRRRGEERRETVSKSSPSKFFVGRGCRVVIT